MATIKEDYCDFETAKLLKEKGFDDSCCRFVIESDETYYRGAPTLQMAMKWLREVHNLQIQIAPINSRYKDWTFGIHRDFSALTIKLICYPTYEEACEAAIKYCLENLI